MKITYRQLLIGFLSLLFIGCEHEDYNTPIKEERYCLKEKFKQKVEMDSAVIKSVTEGIHLNASVEANPDKTVRFVSLIGGIISKVHFSLGDQVTKGQVLAELQSTELTSLESELRNLESQIEVTERELQSTQSMFDDGISSQKELMEIKSELTILKSEKRKITLHLEMFSASAEKGVFKIKAPTTGIITAKSIVSGAQITAEGESLFTITDLSEVWVMIDIYASNVKHIVKGMKLNMTTISYPDTILKGEINAISQVLDSEAKVLKARAVLPNKFLILKPGMLIDVIALKDQDIKAISIPTKSMVFDDNKNFVVVYKGDCEMEIREVEILSQNNGTTFLLKGIEENEKIITKNQLLIYEQIKN